MKGINLSIFRCKSSEMAITSTTSRRIYELKEKHVYKLSKKQLKNCSKLL